MYLSFSLNNISPLTLTSGAVNLSTFNMVDSTHTPFSNKSLVIPDYCLETDIATIYHWFDHFNIANVNQYFSVSLNLFLR